MVIADAITVVHLFAPLEFPTHIFACACEITCFPVSMFMYQIEAVAAVVAAAVVFCHVNNDH